jgi:cold-inducible RNA-binding protein
MNIYVGNLSYDVTEEELRTEFEAYGQVSSVNIIKDKYSGQSKGFAFVEMPVLSEGQAALTGLNGKKLKDRSIAVSGARSRDDSRGGGGGGRSYGNRPSYGSGGGRGGSGGGFNRGKGGGGRDQRKRY